jgi:hypothetical protein
MDRVFASEAKDSSSNLLKVNPPITIMSNSNQLNTTSKTPNLNLICQRQKHAFHILDASPYPFLVSFFLLFLLIPTTLYMHALELPFGLPRADLIHVSFFGLYLTAMSWFISIVKESSQGYHTSKVQQGLRMGMILFILSEVMLFFAFF